MGYRPIDSPSFNFHRCLLVNFEPSQN